MDFDEIRLTQMYLGYWDEFLKELELERARAGELFFLDQLVENEGRKRERESVLSGFSKVVFLSQSTLLLYIYIYSLSVIKILIQPN